MFAHAFNAHNVAAFLMLLVLVTVRVVVVVVVAVVVVAVVVVVIVVADSYNKLATRILAATSFKLDDTQLRRGFSFLDLLR